MKKFTVTTDTLLKNFINNMMERIMSESHGSPVDTALDIRALADDLRVLADGKPMTVFNKYQELFRDGLSEYLLDDDMLDAIYLARQSREDHVILVDNAGGTTQLGVIYAKDIVM